MKNHRIYAFGDCHVMQTIHGIFKEHAAAQKFLNSLPKPGWFTDTEPFYIKEIESDL